MEMREYRKVLKQLTAEKLKENLNNSISYLSRSYVKQATEKQVELSKKTIAAIHQRKLIDLGLGVGLSEYTITSIAVANL